MSDTKEIMALLQQHLNQTAKDNADLRVAIGKVQLTTRHIKKNLEEQSSINRNVNERLNKLKSYSDKQTGAIGLMGFLGISSIIAYLKSFHF